MNKFLSLILLLTLGAGARAADPHAGHHSSTPPQRATAAAEVRSIDRDNHLLGVAHADRVELLLGDGSVSTHLVRDLLPVFSLRRARLRALIADRDLATGAAGAAIPWGDDRDALRIISCGRCPTCDLEVVAHRDLLLVAGMRPVQRERLRAGGILTIDGGWTTGKKM